MIVTVTANPCIDISVEVEELSMGNVNRSLAVRREPGGKGINVSRALALNGVQTVALFPADGISGQWVERELEREGVSSITATVAHEIRYNVAIADAAGITTNINDTGPEMTEFEIDALTAEIVAVLDSRPDWLVAAGSLPPGFPRDFYATLGRLAHEHGTRFACDSSGMPLRMVAESGEADFLKPNLTELREVADRELITVSDVTNACRTYLRQEGEILVSLGAQGALLVTEHETLWATHETVIVESTVGAGDSSVAGFLAADLFARNHRLDPADAREERICNAVAWGAGAVQLPGTALPGPAQITPERVRIEREPDPHTHLEDLNS